MVSVLLQMQKPYERGRALAGAGKAAAASGLQDGDPGFLPWELSAS